MATALWIVTLSSKVGFLEFGAEWVFCTIEDCLHSGRVFFAPEAEDRLLIHEIELVGEEQVLYGSDFPHGEEREEAAMRFIERTELTSEQKEKIFYRNAAKFFGEP